MKSATILTIAVFVCVATAAVGQEAGIRPQVPIVIKHSAEGYDPCKYGVVHNLDPKGDGFLAVKGRSWTALRTRRQTKQRQTSLHLRGQR
jgi:hypothetical protein